jgi:hypothetical protein
VLRAVEARQVDALMLEQLHLHVDASTGLPHPRTHALGWG